MDEIVAFFLTVILFIGCTYGVCTGISSCQREDSELKMKQQKQCFELTQDPNCFPELKYKQP